MLKPESIKILVAEDNYINQKLINKLLINKGYDVTIVDDGQKVLDEIEKAKYHLVLMDIQMLVMDGYQSTKIIRAKEITNGTYIPIIAVTAFAMESDKQKCFEIGMDDYISKPFNKDDFYKIIEKHLLIHYG
ncbi:MAG TPA: response regulator [Ignavibacteria bacterium]|nr:response regulator [Ignavibacteria bacterium]